MKQTNVIKLPKINDEVLKEKHSLPFNGNLVSENSLSFSFACFDRNHELFNLGCDNKGTPISGTWFIELLDCLKSVSNKTVSEIRHSSHDLHPIDWNKTNVKQNTLNNQLEYWQFRINKSKGRIIGFIIDGVFYIVWLDPYHNLTNSEGYGKEVYYKQPKSIYEKQECTIMELREENKVLNELLESYK